MNGPIAVKNMMRSKRAAAGLLLAFVLIGWLCWYFSDKQAIRRQLVGLTWDVNKKSQESTMETALKMREVKAGLAARCRLIVPETHYDEAAEKDLVIMYLMSYRDRFETLAVSFAKMDVEIPVKGKAVVQATVQLQTQKQGAAPAEVSAPIKLELQKQDGDWLLQQAEIPELLVQQMDR